MTSPAADTGPVRIPLRVLHVTNDLRLNGTGHTNSTIDVAIAQAARGDDVTIVCLTSDDPTERLLARSNVRLETGIGTRWPIAMLRSVRRLRRLISGADVVHIHTVRSIAVAAAGGPLHAWRRSVATLHNPHQRSTIMMATARRVVTLSAVQQADLRRRTLGIRRAAVVLNGTASTPRLEPVGEIGREPLPPDTVLFVGALHERKGLDVLIRSMAQVCVAVPSARLVIIGNRDAPRFERLTAELGISSRVRFVGFVPDPRTYMLSCAVFVLPSRQEGFGNVLTEARECGVPIIASRVGGIPEALAGGKAGLLVDPGDPDALAAALISVLENQQRAGEMRRASRADLDFMRPERAAADYDRVYRSILPRPGLLFFGRRNVPRP